MRTSRPNVTIAIAVATAASYFLVETAGRSDYAAIAAGFIPARISGLQVQGALPAFLTPLTCTLLHGGLIHLGFNLLTLIFCGREDEVALGPWGTGALYVIGAYAAAAAQFLAGPHSAMPTIGASGAVSALVGAYAILYGQRRPSSLNPELARWLHVLWLAAAWVGLQLLNGVALAMQGVAIATAAHIGGFFAGVLLARPLLRWRYRHA